MTQARTKIREIADVNVEDSFRQVSAQTGPVVIRDLVSDWPLVKSARVSNAEIGRCLLEYATDAQVTAFIGEANTTGRIFYTDELAATNFRQIRTQLGWVLDQLQQAESDPAPPTIYMGSMALDHCLPGFSDHNSLPRHDVQATVRIWIGNRTTVAAHYDVMDNIACVCAGRRRFTLFPPDQLANLYVGPIDFTPAGQPISLVDLAAPDFETYPRFAEALEHAQTAELGPGDAIFIPAMWWHHVQGLDSLNILINHWWRDVPAYMGAPGDALLHAILNIRALPQEQRTIWRGIFDHYVFASGSATTAHIPKDRRGVLGELDDNAARKIRTLLRNKLNR